MKINYMTKSKIMIGLFSFLGIIMVVILVSTNFAEKGTYSVVYSCSKYGSNSHLVGDKCYSCNGSDEYSNMSCRSKTEKVDSSNGEAPGCTIKKEVYQCSASPTQVGDAPENGTCASKYSGSYECHGDKCCKCTKGSYSDDGPSCQWEQNEYAEGCSLKNIIYSCPKIYSAELDGGAYTILEDGDSCSSPVGSYYNEISAKCECPTGKEEKNGKCVEKQTSDTCSDDKVKAQDGNKAGQCVSAGDSCTIDNKRGVYQAAGKCVTCGEHATMDSNNMCKCDDGYTGNAYTGCTLEDTGNDDDDTCPNDKVKAQDGNKAGQCVSAGDSCTIDNKRGVYQAAGKCVTCGEHATMDSNNICKCDDGYTGNAYTGCTANSETAEKSICYCNTCNNGEWTSPAVGGKSMTKDECDNQTCNGTLSFGSVLSKPSSCKQCTYNTESKCETLEDTDCKKVNGCWTPKNCYDWTNSETCTKHSECTWKYVGSSLSCTYKTNACTASNEVTECPDDWYCTANDATGCWIKQGQIGKSCKTSSGKTGTWTASGCKASSGDGCKSTEVAECPEGWYCTYSDETGCAIKQGEIGKSCTTTDNNTGEWTSKGCKCSDTRTSCAQKGRYINVSTNCCAGYIDNDNDDGDNNNNNNNNDNNNNSGNATSSPVDPTGETKTCYVCVSGEESQYVWASSSTNAAYAATTLSGITGKNCATTSESNCQGIAVTNCYECNGSKKYVMANSDADAKSQSGGTSCTIVVTDKCNTIDPPKTGTIGIIAAWIIGMMTIGYAMWYFKKSSSLN